MPVEKETLPSLVEPPYVMGTTDGPVGTLSMRLGESRQILIFRRQAGQQPFNRRNSAGSNPLSPSTVILPCSITNDVATYFIDEKYDARDAQSLTEAEIHGREQARAYLQAIRTLPGCENAYILATGPEIGHVSPVT